jgi:hypothetical protein
MKPYKKHSTNNTKHIKQHKTQYKQYKHSEYLCSFPVLFGKCKLHVCEYAA